MDYYFTGRIPRDYYAMGSFLMVLISIIVALFNTDGNIGVKIAMLTIWSIIASVVFVSLSIRRLHDMGKTGLWTFMALVPVVNILLWGWLLITPSQQGDNEYGPAY